MIKFIFRLSCLVFFGFAGLAGAQAQVYGTDYISFEGTAVVLDNPTSPACQADGIHYNDQYRVSYRYTANPSVISDALAFYPSGDNAAKMNSTQSPSLSLSGPSTTTWSYINHYGNEGSGLTSSSNLNIESTLDTGVTLGTAVVKIRGSIGDFLAWNNCNISQIHAALVLIPQ
jgi:hypothetical protein